jgi:hypothetical protein
MLQAKQCINEWNDTHAYEMQVQLWEPNTVGVTTSTRNYHFTIHTCLNSITNVGKVF